MYKNLNAESLGISARQNELIELAMTYGFRGFDLDVETFSRQLERGTDHAVRFVQSAGIKIGGLELPVRWAREDEIYREDLHKLTELAEAAASIGVRGFMTTVRPFNDGRPYHEDFEFHRQRFTEIGEILAPHGIHLGLGFRARAPQDEGRETPFIVTPDALMTLVKTIVGSNIGICVDLWDWHVGGGTIDLLKELAPEQIIAVRIADVPADVDLASVTEAQRVSPGSTGVVPAVEAFQVLSNIGYRGPLTPFCHPSQFSGITRNKVVEQVSKGLDALLRPPLEEPVAAEVAAVQ